MFFVVFDHGNECASMRSLVKIHNNCNLNIGLKVRYLGGSINLMFGIQIITVFLCQLKWNGDDSLSI